MRWLSAAGVPEFVPCQHTCSVFVGQRCGVRNHVVAGSADRLAREKWKAGDVQVA